MPELPEVETIRRQLQKVLVGQAIKKITVRRAKSWQGDKQAVAGKKILGVERKAKMFVIKLSGGMNLWIHLKMTGQLVYTSKPEARNPKPETRIAGGHPTADWVSKLPSKHTRVVLGLSRGRLFFNDMRVFGWVKTVSDKKLKAELDKLPPDVIDKEATAEYLKKILASSRRAVKLVICDQAKLGGVGNIYANDALFCAGIDPRRQAQKITNSQFTIFKLHKCLRKVINNGIKYGGATPSGEKFVNLAGMGGRDQDNVFVC